MLPECLRLTMRCGRHYVIVAVPMAVVRGLEMSGPVIIFQSSPDGVQPQMSLQMEDWPRTPAAEEEPS